ncbi:MAG: SMC-Scp complex subunit ScpB [Cyanobacteria bacterium P01_H01_bin.119]
MPSLTSKIEAILYLKGQPLSIAQIAEYAGCDRDEVEDGLIELMSDYAHRDTALEVVETTEGYSLQLRSLFKHLVNTLIPLDLGIGALRTLAAIALKGPISQTDLVELRGSGIYQQVPDLVSAGFVRKRRQSDGRSYWLQVTDKFYQHFEIDQLPAVQPKKSQPSAAQAKEHGASTQTTLPLDENKAQATLANVSELPEAE